MMDLFNFLTAMVCERINHNAKISLSISDISNLITTFVVVGTFLFGFISLRSLRESEKQARDDNLKIADFEKRRDYLLSHLSKYIAMLDVHKLTYMAITDEEYEGKEIEIYQHLYKLETFYYKIQIILNTENPCFDEFSKTIKDSISLAKEIRFENSMAELFSNGLRTPERAVEIAKKVIRTTKQENSKATVSDEINREFILNNISNFLSSRNEHLENYLAGVSKFEKLKEEVVVVSRKYLISEKNILNLKGKNK